MEGNITLQNSSHSCKTEVLLEVSGQACRGPSKPPAKRPMMEPNDQSLFEVQKAQGHNAMVVISVSDLKELIQSTVKSSVKAAVAEIEFKTGKQIKSLNDKIEELKNIIIKNKSFGEQIEFLTFDDLLRKYNIKTILDPTDAEPFSRPVFRTKEAFDLFDKGLKNFMPNERFVKDLCRYFNTAINQDGNLLEETKDIMKKFFYGPMLHAHFTSTKNVKDKELLCNTAFGKVLADCLNQNFNGKIMKRKSGRSVVETTVDEKEVWSAIGKACTDSSDWDGGRRLRGLNVVNKESKFLINEEY